MRTVCFRADLTDDLVNDDDVTRSYRSVRSVFGRLLRSNAVPKAIVVCVLVVVAYSVLRAAVLILDIDFFVRCA